MLLSSVLHAVMGSGESKASNKDTDAVNSMSSVGYV